jgi:Kef-type K+ transport system membrane component KefB
LLFSFDLDSFSYATEVIGIHAFGAFMAGAIMPENTKFRTLFIDKVEDVALVLLSPLFFVFTGLRTQIGLLNDSHLWMTAGFIILTAVIGKFAGSAHRKIFRHQLERKFNDRSFDEYQRFNGLLS